MVSLIDFSSRSDDGIYQMFDSYQFSLHENLKYEAIQQKLSLHWRWRIHHFRFC